MRHAMAYAFLLLLFAHSTAQAEAPNVTPRDFNIAVEGQTLNGLLFAPGHTQAQATIILVHGYGRSNIRYNGFYHELARRFGAIGLNTYTWDKPGCGDSEGTFDINQPVASSADEVVSAVKMLRASGIAGTETVGLWGVSRAGWIAPLAMQQDPNIAFWISISGPDDKENFRYLLESNFPLEGRSPEETRSLVDSWQRQFNAAWQGGTFEDAMQGAETYFNDPFIQLMGFQPPTEAGFLAFQKQFQDGKLLVDKDAELMIYVPRFEDMLRSINRPVLAIFGEKDTNIDWRQTRKLYKETLGENPKASLTLHVFPNANHDLRISETGSYREIMQQLDFMPIVDGYFESMTDWLVERGFGQATPAHSASSSAPN